MKNLTDFKLYLPPFSPLPSLSPLPPRRLSSLPASRPHPAQRSGILVFSNRVLSWHHRLPGAYSAWSHPHIFSPVHRYPSSSCSSISSAASLYNSREGYNPGSGG